MKFYQGLPFGQVREDPAVELWVVDQVAPLRRGLIIASAGCTAFSLATRPARWTALDANPHQIELCRRKAALLAGSDRQALLEEIAKMNRSGRADRMLDTLAWLYRTFLHSRGEVEAFFRLNDVEAQRRRFDSRWQGWVWRTCFRLAMAKPLMRWLYGPVVDVFPRGFADTLRLQVETALCDRPAATNLYLWQLFLGRYPEGLFPYYLSPQSLDALRGVEIDIQVGDLGGWLETQPPGELDFLGLSNVLEVATLNEMSELARRVGQAGRSGALVVMRRIIPQSYREGVEPHLSYRAELSQAAQARESGAFCRTVEVYQVP